MYAQLSPVFICTGRERFNDIFSGTGLKKLKSSSKIHIVFIPETDSKYRCWGEKMFLMKFYVKTIKNLSFCLSVVLTNYY